MSAQADDKLLWDGKEYICVGIEIWDDVFNPTDFGFKPGYVDTGCWSGYYLKLAIENNQLYFEELTIHDEDGNYPDVNGVAGVDDGTGYHRYKSIHKSLDYSNKLIIASDYILPHGVTVLPMHLKDIQVLSFSNGKLIDQKNFNGKMWKEIW